ncbi:MAG: hypothetical protein WEB85_10445 [Dongiaceae bacterium]
MTKGSAKLHRRRTEMIVSPNGGESANLDGIERKAVEEFAEPFAFGDSQCQRVLQAWFPVLRKLAAEKAPDNEWQYKRIVDDATEILRDLKGALSRHVKSSDSPFIRNPEEKAKLAKREKEHNGTLWYVPDRWSIRDRPDHWDEASPVSPRYLVAALGKYLARPELQHDLIDWACTNALLFDELARTADGIKSGIAFGKINWAYTLGDGKELTMAWATLGLLFLKFFLRWLLPATLVAGLIYFAWFTAAAIVGATWAVYMLYRLLTYPARRKEHKTQANQLAKYMVAIHRMSAAWVFASSDVVHPGRLRELVISAEGAGTVYPPIHLMSWGVTSITAEGAGIVYRPILHSLLDRMIQRNSSFLAPFITPCEVVPLRWTGWQRI